MSVLVHRKFAALVALFAVLAGCGSTQRAAVEPERLRLEVLGTVDHDVRAYTQGLEIAGNKLYEGTGLRGRSQLRVLDPNTGALRQHTALSAELFGEGITITGDHLWQLTWQSGVALLRDRHTLAELKRVEYQGEGWGLCFDGTSLVMSDGSGELTFRDPHSFAPIRTLSVYRNNPDDTVTALNELECAHGSVWANVYRSDEILRIDPRSGAVTGVVDASGLLTAEERRHADVLNGIAAIPGTDQFLITGKLWPHLFVVRIRQD